MPENTAVSGSSDASADRLQETFGKLNIQDEHGGKQGVHTNRSNSNSNSDHAGTPDCIFYLKHGVCGYGINCRYKHPLYNGQEHLPQGDLPERVGQLDCQHFLKTGTCKYGYTCKYNHPENRIDDGQMSFNSLGLPMRQEKSCPYYMKTGYCKFGVACKFNHPEPTTFGTVLPLSGSSSYAPVGSSMVSPSGIPLLGGVPSWSLPRQYVLTPQINGFPSYVPYGLPSSPMQQGWSTYMGTVSPSPSNGKVNNSNHIEFASSTRALLPERPDQPDCHYYMKNGCCKYGSSCKYHHPRDRFSTACVLGPLGLPLRPGQAVCTFYSTYGSCSYGLSCKYDHPQAGYCSHTIPAFSVADPSVPYAYQRSSPVVWTPVDAVNPKSSRLSDSFTRSEAISDVVEHMNTNLSDDAPLHASPTQNQACGSD